MRMFPVLGLALSLACSTGLPAMAATPDGMGGPMAKCTAKDPAVIVNTAKMTYMADTKANRSAMKGMMNDDKFVCKSTAVKMGAKMKTPSMTMMEKPVNKM